MTWQTLGSIVDLGTRLLGSRNATQYMHRLSGRLWVLSSLECYALDWPTASTNPMVDGPYTIGSSSGINCMHKRTCRYEPHTQAFPHSFIRSYAKKHGQGLEIDIMCCVPLLLCAIAFVTGSFVLVKFIMWRSPGTLATLLCKASSRLDVIACRYRSQMSVM